MPAGTAWIAPTSRTVALPRVTSHIGAPERRAVTMISSTVVSTSCAAARGGAMATADTQAISAMDAHAILPPQTLRPSNIMYCLS